MAAALPENGRRGSTRRSFARTLEGRGRGKKAAVEGAARGRRELPEQGGGARRPRALEGPPRRGDAAPRRRRRAGGFDARAIVDMDPHSREPPPRSGSAP